MHISIIGHGPDLVMLHGWSMHSGVWQALAEQLAQQFTVHLVDLPGHGHSEWQAGQFELTSLLGELSEALPEQAIYLGWSLGGTIALAMAQHYPGRVGELVLLASSPCFTQRPDWLNAMKPEVFSDFSNQLEVDQTKTLQQFLLLQAQGSRERKETVKALAQRMAELGPAQHDALVAGLALLVESDMRVALSELQCPAIVILGERDTLIPSQVISDIAAIQPALVTKVILGAGHAPFISHPQQCEQAILDFIVQGGGADV